MQQEASAQARRTRAGAGTHQLPLDQTQPFEPPRRLTGDCNLKNDPNRQTVGPEKREES
jgi:hypothetical protein